MCDKLTPAETERLAILMEESAEVIHVCGKILRHGYESAHPDGGPTNLELLEKELGHVSAAMTNMSAAQDFDMSNVYEHYYANKLGDDE